MYITSWQARSLRANTGLLDVYGIADIVKQYGGRELFTRATLKRKTPSPPSVDEIPWDYLWVGMAKNRLPPDELGKLRVRRKEVTRS